MNRQNQIIINDLFYPPGETNPTRHNYARKIQALIDSGVIKDAGICRVLHDDWCAWFRDREGNAICNCDPDIRHVITGQLLQLR